MSNCSTDFSSVRLVQLSDMSNCLESPTMSKMSKCTPFPSVRHVKLSAKYCPPHLSNIVLILLLLLESLTKKLQHFLIGFLKMLTMTFQSRKLGRTNFFIILGPRFKQVLRSLFAIAIECLLLFTFKLQQI